MWTCIKCNAVNEDTYTICPKCGAARSAGRFGSGNAAPARNAAAYTAPVQQRVMPSGEPAAPAHANAVAPQTAYYADFSHVRAGRGFMLLGRVLAIVMAVLTLLLAWRQYDAVSAAVLGLIFDDLAALSAFVKLLIYIPLALAAAAIGKDLGMIDNNFFNAIIILSIVTTLPVPTLVRFIIARTKMKFTEETEEAYPVPDEKLQDELL